MNNLQINLARLTGAKRRFLALAQITSTSHKLAVAFALFLLPLGFIAGKLAHEQQRNVDIARQERAGAAYLRIVNEAHSLLNMQARVQQLGHENIDNVSPAVRALRLAENRYGATLGTAEYSERAIFALQVMQSSARLSAADAARVALTDLAHQIGDRASLMRDPERASHFAVDVTLDRAPALAQEARDLAQLASQAFEDQRLSESEQALLLQRLAVLERASEALSAGMDAMMSSAEEPRLAETLGPPTYAVLTNMGAYRAIVQGVLNTGRFNTETLVAAEAGAQFTLADLSARVSDALDTMLLARAERYADERTATLLWASFLFLVVLLSVIALLRIGIVQPIDSLSQSIRALADGCYEADIPALHRSDEIGDMARALAVLRDAAQAKIAADAARAAAESANLAKSQFVAAMSHELRTPLNAIIGYAEILAEDAEGRGDETMQDDLQRINFAARHLLAVINDILDLSKMEAGRMDVLAAPSDPVAIAHEAVETARPLATKTGNTLFADLPPVNTSFVDAQKLRQCLLNLLSNAAKFCENGHIAITMTLSGEGKESRLIFKVSDTGIGISSDQMTRLFRPFEQANAAITRRYGGTGLGLMITRRMAQLMGGDVSVESKLGLGTTFTLWVPQFYQGFGAGSEDIGAREGAAEAPLVVVVDDESSARDLAIRTLTPLGLAVQGVRTAGAGVDLVRSARPALVILDINLPDRDGWSVISELALDPETADIPILVLSIEEDRRRSRELGAREHLVKPTTRDQLCATVLRLAGLSTDDDELRRTA